MSAMPLIVAHRGYSTKYRENSPAAWTGAIEAGADVIEVDLRVTRDGAVVCCHDDNLQRLAGRADAIADCDSAELAMIEAAGAPAAPPLQLLWNTVGADHTILFDIKDERPEALDILVAALVASNRDKLILGLHKTDAVRHVRAGNWKGQILGLLQDLGEADSFFTSGGDILRIWERDASSERIAAHRDLGRPVWITTGSSGTPRKVGDFDDAELIRMTRDGAGGFLVNDPVAAKAAFADGAA